MSTTPWHGGQGDTDAAVIPAEPYDFPIGGAFEPARTALVIVDMQRDFCDPQGYMHTRGDDITAARALIPRILAVREAATEAGLRIVYTRQGVRPDLSDLTEQTRLVTARSGAEIGSTGPLGRLLVRGEPGWEVIPELTPRPGEPVVDKAGTGAFYATDLHHLLQHGGVDNLVLVGVTTGVCVQTTAREAADRGYGVLLLEDCCAEPRLEDHHRAVALLQVEGGYLATVARSDCFIAALSATSSQPE